MLTRELLRFSVIAVGAMSRPLRRHFDSICQGSHAVVVRSRCISDANAMPEDFPTAFLDDVPDYTWLFINESEIAAPAVMEVIALASGKSPVMIDCYTGGNDGGHASDADWPTSWPPRLGPHRMTFARYSDSEEDCFDRLDHFSGKSAREGKPVYFGRDARMNDPLYAEARAVVLREKRASISLVQRHLHIGYFHAIRLLDAMEGDILARKGQDGLRQILELYR